MVKTIVSLSDFNNELLIAGVENPTLGVHQDVCALIAEREPEYLTNLLLSLLTVIGIVCPM